MKGKAGGTCSTHGGYGKRM